MIDDRDEVNREEEEQVRFLREKATQLRKLAAKHRFPPDHELFEIADDFEQFAHDLERRERRR